MISNFESTPTTEFEADVCIIGAGAAGISCALEFVKGPLRVLLLEGGSLRPDARHADLHRAEIVGLPHSGVHSARERVVGGTTTTWGGQALPFAAEDFLERAWIQNSGWPLAAAELASYYTRAEKVLKLDADVTFDARPWGQLRVREPEFLEQTLELFVSKWSPRPNFGECYRREITTSRHLHLLYNANAVNLRVAPGDGRIEAVEVKSLGGRTGTISARHIILAGGAIETARLLLASRDVQPNGIGNAHDLVGRYFQDHTAAVIGLVRPKDRTWFNDLFEPIYVRRFKYLPRIRFSERRAAAAQILHAGLQIVAPGRSEEGIECIKLLASRLKRRQLSFADRALVMAALRSPPDVARGLFRRLGQGRGVFTRSGPIWLECHCEQEPLPESRVTLSDESDALGMPRVRLDWRVSELTLKTMRHVAALAQAEFRRTGLAEIVMDDWLSGSSLDWRRHVGDVFHQCGTARMGRTSREGVVDSDCKVFETTNLFVASSAVFPTSSFSNPTMSIIALSMRLCDHIKNLEARSRTSLAPLVSRK